MPKRQRRPIPNLVIRLPDENRERPRPVTAEWSCSIIEGRVVETIRAVIDHGATRIVLELSSRESVAVSQVLQDATRDSAQRRAQLEQRIADRRAA